MPATLAACVECGTKFLPGDDAVYCSVACRQRAHLQRSAEGRQFVLPSTTIGSLISTLEAVTTELENHVADMNYSCTDEFNVHTFARHPFNEDAPQVIHELVARMEQVGNDLYSALEEHHTYAGLTLQQKEARTLEFEELAYDAQAVAARETESRRRAAGRETAWAALAPQLTAPGRYCDSVKQCGQCGGRVETIEGIRRCWACFRRSQNGR